MYSSGQFVVGPCAKQHVDHAKSETHRKYSTVAVVVHALALLSLDIPAATADIDAAPATVTAGRTATARVAVEVVLLGADDGLHLLEQPAAAPLLYFLAVLAYQDGEVFVQLVSEVADVVEFHLGGAEPLDAEGWRRLPVDALDPAGARGVWGWSSCHTCLGRLALALDIGTLRNIRSPGKLSTCL